MQLNTFLKHYLSSHIFAEQFALQDSTKVKTANSNGSCTTGDSTTQAEPLLRLV